MDRALLARKLMKCQDSEQCVVDKADGQEISGKLGSLTIT